MADEESGEKDWCKCCKGDSVTLFCIVVPILCTTLFPYHLASAKLESNLSSHRWIDEGCCCAYGNKEGCDMIVYIDLLLCFLCPPVAVFLLWFRYFKTDRYRMYNPGGIGCGRTWMIVGMVVLALFFTILAWIPGIVFALLNWFILVILDKPQ